MVYVVGEIVIWLAAAGLAGLGVGWLLARVGRRPARAVPASIAQTQQLEAAELAELEQEAERFAAMTAQLEGLVGEHNETLTTLRSEADAATSLVAERERELAVALERIEALEAVGSSVVTDADAIDVEAVGLRRELDEREAEVRDLRAELEQLSARLAEVSTVAEDDQVDAPEREAEVIDLRDTVEHQRAQLTDLGETIELHEMETIDLRERVAERERELAGAREELAARTAQVAELQPAVAERESAAARVAELEAVVAEREAAAARVAELEAVVAEREAAAARVAELEAVVAEREAAAAQVSDLEQAVSQRDVALARWESNDQDRSSDRARLETEVHQRDVALARWEKSHAEQQAQIAELEDELTNLKVTTPSAAERIAALEAALEDEVARRGDDSLRQRVTELEAQLAEQRAGASSLRTQVAAAAGPNATTNGSTHTDAPALSSDLEPDSLERISGIGPKLAGALREHGVGDIHELAQLTADRVAALSEQVPLIGQRVEREAWVEQARRLCEQLDERAAKAE